VNFTDTDSFHVFSSPW